MPPPTAADVADAFRRYFPLLAAKCARMLGDRDDAEDVAQESFERLWSKRVDLRDVRAVTAWLYRTSTHLAIDRYRRRAKSTTDVDWEKMQGGAADPEARANVRSMLAHLASRLEPRQLELAILSRLDGLTHNEIVEVTGLSERTVRRALADFEARVTRLRERGDA